VDEPQLPPQALREALVNAFCHRDYSIYGGSISIALFDDRLEISSDGGMPFGQKAEDLKRDHKSILRNPLIADVLYRRGLIEKWGRGTQRMVEACTEMGLPEPVFVENVGSVLVTFPIGQTKPTAGLTETVPSEDVGIAAQVEAQVKAQVEAQVASRVRISPVMLKILTLCEGPKRSSEITESLGYKKRSGGMKKDLSFLLSSGLLRFTIPEKPHSRNQMYITTERGLEVLLGSR
jgi:predicted HTH transcriptional regulator